MPDPIEDPTLGSFTWDQENGFWLGSIDEPSNDSTWLALQVGPSEGEAALALAHQAVVRIRELEPEARRFLAAELPNIQSPEASARTPADIDGAVAQLALFSVTAHPDGVLDLIFGNQQVFGAVQFFVWFDGAGDRGWDRSESQSQFRAGRQSHSSQVRIMH
jgi:hypothetical protein